MFWRNVFVSISSMLIISCVIYIGSKSILGDDSAAKTLAGLPLLAVKNVYEFLEKRQVKSRIEDKNFDAIPQLADYAVYWFALVLQGIVIFAGCSYVSSSVTGFGIGMASHFTGLENPLPPGFVIVASIPLISISMYFFGSWLGTRSGRYGYASLLIAAIMGNFLLVEIDQIMAEKIEGFREFLIPGQYTGWASLLTNFTNSLKGVLLLSIPMSIGFFIGRRRRLSRYIAFLLSVLPQNTRSTLIEIAHDEARNIALR